MLFAQDTPCGAWTSPRKQGLSSNSCRIVHLLGVGEFRNGSVERRALSEKDSPRSTRFGKGARTPQGSLGKSIATLGISRRGAERIAEAAENSRRSFPSALSASSPRLGVKHFDPVSAILLVDLPPRVPLDFGRCRILGIINKPGAQATVPLDSPSLALRASVDSPRGTVVPAATCANFEWLTPHRGCAIRFWPMTFRGVRSEPGPFHTSLKRKRRFSISSPSLALQACVKRSWRCQLRVAHPPPGNLRALG